MAKVGDIWCSSWGYEQTNVQFFKVTKVTESFVTLCEMGTVRLDTDMMTGAIAPIDCLTGKPFWRKLKHSPYGDYIEIESYQIARPWDGRPMHYSTYA